MRYELYQIEEIENYLEGKMGAEERVVFESRMKADEQLRHYVKTQEQLITQIRVNAFRNEIQQFHSAYTKAATVKSRGYGFYLNSLLLFGVLGLVVAFVYYIWSSDGIRKNNTPVVTARVLPVQQKKDKPVSGTTVVAEKNPNEPATAVRPGPVQTIRKKTIVPDQIPGPDQPGQKKPLPPPSAEDAPYRHFFLSAHTQQIDASAGGDVVTKDSRSVIHFPGGIMTDQHGNEVTGMVEIRYREYRHAGQMAFSDIPMEYTEGGKKYRFNSAGMFDIRAYQDGKELKIKPGAAFRVDYNVTEQKDSCYFFALDEKTRTWKKISPIAFSPAEKNKNDGWMEIPRGSGQVFVRVKDAVTGKNISKDVFTSFVSPMADLYVSNICLDSGYNVSAITRGTYNMKVALDGYREMTMADIQVFDGRITFVEAELTPTAEKQEGREKGELNGEGNKTNGYAKERNSGGFWRLFKKDRTHLNHYVMRLSGDKTVPLPVGETASRMYIGKKTQDNMMGDTDAGHYFPDMVRGLKCESFGIYNCDQIYRMKDPVTVSAIYRNTAGEIIGDAYVVSVIDLAYNGAFSFEPSQFTCSRSGRNVVLLFTRSKKLYALPAGEFEKAGLTVSGEYTFTMTDITSQVTNPEELRQYLRLK